VYKDVYPHLKDYDEAWDLDDITLVHKLYNGTRRWYQGPKRGTTEKIHKWGPYMFICDACGTSRQTYAMIIKHQTTCKKMVG